MGYVNNHGVFLEGDFLEFSKDLDGVCRINKGECAVYLGDSQARILTGPSRGWVVTLCIDAPVEIVHTTPAEQLRMYLQSSYGG